MSYDSGFGDGAGMSHENPMGPGIRMQSPMLGSHRDEDTTKVPYLPLTLTTQHVLSQTYVSSPRASQLHRWNSWAPYCSFQKLEAHSLAHTCHPRAQETEEGDYMSSRPAWATQRRWNSPIPHFLLDKVANPRLAK